MSFLRTLLRFSTGRPSNIVPAASLLCRSVLGSRPFYIQCTCLSRRKRLCDGLTNIIIMIIIMVIYMCYFFRRAHGPFIKKQHLCSPKVLKMCSSQLCEILCTIFNLSFQSGVVPDIWKTSCIVPVPKNNKVGSMNDLRPVALTSVAFKTCERIVLPQLKSFIHDSLDPFQFAYQSNRSCEDALLVTINEVTSHLDSKLSVKKKQS